MSNVLGYTYKDVSTLSKYVTGVAINHTGLDLGAGVAGYLVFDGAIKGGSWLLNNKKAIKADGLWKTALAKIKEQGKVEQSLKGKNLWETANNFAHHSTLTNLNNKYKAFTKLPAEEVAKLKGDAYYKYLQNVAKSDYYKDVRKLLKQAEKLSGDAYKTKMKEVYEAIAKADLNVHNAKVAGELAPISKFGKITQKVKNATGVTKLTTASKQLAAKSSTFRTIAKGVKGGGAFAAISLLAETPEIYSTYKEMGATAGTKQLGRSAANVAAETAGFIVGMKAGAALGAAIGTFIPVPVVGTAVGAVLGAAVGLAGSWVAGKATRSVLGESELEQKKTYDANVLALKAKFQPEIELAILQAAQEKLSQETDASNPDTVAALKSFENLAQKYQEA